MERKTSTMILGRLGTGVTLHGSAASGNFQNLPRERDPTWTAQRLKALAKDMVAEWHVEGCDLWAMSTFPPTPRPINFLVRVGVRKALGLPRNSSPTPRRDPR